jgi:hypothetical protein
LSYISFQNEGVCFGAVVSKRLCFRDRIWYLRLVNWSSTLFCNAPFSNSLHLVYNRGLSFLVWEPFVLHLIKFCNLCVRKTNIKILELDD